MKRVDEDIKKLVAEYGLAGTIAALARYCHAPPAQHYPTGVMATCFRRLNKLYEYLCKE